MRCKGLFVPISNQPNLDGKDIAISADDLRSDICIIALSLQ